MKGCGVVHVEGGRGRGRFKSYHISDSVQAFSCLSTSGAAQGIVPYILEVFDVQSKCSYMYVQWTKILTIPLVPNLVKVDTTT